MKCQVGTPIRPQGVTPGSLVQSTRLRETSYILMVVAMVSWHTQGTVAQPGDALRHTLVTTVTFDSEATSDIQGAVGAISAVEMERSGGGEVRRGHG